MFFFQVSYFFIHIFEYMQSKMNNIHKLFSYLRLHVWLHYLNFMFSLIFFIIITMYFSQAKQQHEDKRNKKRTEKRKKKLEEKLRLRLMVPGDPGPTEASTEGLFSIKSLTRVRSEAILFSFLFFLHMVINVLGTY